MNRMKRRINRRRQIASAKRRMRRHNLIFSDVELNEDSLGAIAGWNNQTNLQKDDNAISQLRGIIVRNVMLNGVKHLLFIKELDSSLRSE